MQSERDNVTATDNDFQAKNSGWKKWALLLFKLTVSVSLLGYLFSKLDFDEVHASLAKVSYWYLFLTAAVLLFQAIAGAVRLSMVLRLISSRIGRYAALQIMFIGMFFNQTLPSSVGGDAMRILRIRHHGFPLRVAINSVLLDRLIALVALGGFMLLTYPILYGLVSNLSLRIMVVLASLALMTGFAFLYYFHKIPRRFYGWRITDDIRQISAGAYQIMRTPRRALKITALSVGMHALTGVAIYQLARGLGLSIGLLECVVLTPPISLITALPISIAGWGVREAGMVTALAFAGVAPNDALVISILFGLLLIVISIPGGIYWLYTHRQLSPYDAHK